MARRIDHLVLAAPGLDEHSAFYEKIGFQVGAPNRHPWGTVNRIVQLKGSFLELIDRAPGFHVNPDHDPHNFSFSGFIEGYLQRRQGPAMAAFTSDDAEADSRAFRVMGIGDFEPFHFQRRGKGADGSARELAFTLAFARSDLITEAGFFSCHNHFPENFWDERLQVHENGAQRLDAVIMVAENPADHGEFLSHLTGVRNYAASSSGIRISLDGEPAQTFSVLTPHAYAQRYGEKALPEEFAGPALAACCIGVSSVDKMEALLLANSVPFESRNGAVVIAPDAAFGVALVFLPESG